MLKTPKCQSARLNSLSPRRNLNFQRRNAVLSKKCGKKWGCAAATPIANRRSIANQLARDSSRSCCRECDWLTQYLLRTVHSFSLLYFLFFFFCCETDDLVCKIISVSETRIKNCIVKSIDNVKQMTKVGYFLHEAKQS